MAYVLKYQSDFYNRFGTLVSIKIYKDGYSGDVINVRTQSVQLEWNFEDFNIPVAGTGISISIVNDTQIFNYFEDLLRAYPRTFKCIIEYDGELVFEGFNIIELNEIGLLEYNIITVKFTDYLKMLKYDYLTELKGIGGHSRLLTLIEEALKNTGLIHDLHVNSTLFERSTEEDDSVIAYTCFWHTWSEKCIFYKDPFEYQNTYEVLNNILKPFSAFLYSYKNKWIIERYEDIGRNGDWVKYELNSSYPFLGEYSSNLKQEINKQNGDFNYIESKQRLEYKPGIQKIKIALEEKELSTLVFNEFSENPPTVGSKWPVTLPTIREWYITDNISTFETGVGLDEIDIYCKWNSGESSDAGMFYNFILSTNDKYGVKADNALTIEFKLTTESRRAAGGIGFGNIDVIGIYVFVFIDLRTGFYLKFNTDGTITTSNDPCWLTGSLLGEEIEIDKENPQRIITFSKTLHLGDIRDTVPDDTLPMIIGIHTPYWQTKDPLGAGYLDVVYIGDFSVRFDSDYEDNEVEAYVDENHCNTEEFEINLYDLPNWNFATGLFSHYGSSLGNIIKSNEWYSENYDISSNSTLIDNFLYNRYRRSAGSKSILNATISLNNHLKPFAIITDDNIQALGEESSGGITKFIIIGYSWNLVEGTYDIIAEEYPDTDITIINV